MCAWLCFYCVCILQSVSRVAHVNDCVEDRSERRLTWRCGIVVILFLQGGAVFINEGTGTFTDCTFTSNTAVSHRSHLKGTCRHLTVVVCVTLFQLRVYFAGSKSYGACE